MTNPQLTSFSTVKSWENSFKIRSKDVHSHHSYLAQSQPEQLGKKNKWRASDWEGNAKLSLFSGDMTLYIEQPKALPWWLNGKDPPANAGDMHWSGKISYTMEQLSLCATTTEPVCCNYWSPCTYSLCSVTREAIAMRSPCTAIKSSPRSPKLEKAMHSNEDLAQPKVK